MKKRALCVIMILCMVMALYFYGMEKTMIMAKIQGYQALKTFERIKDTQLIEGFMTYETRHFLIKYKSKDENVVRPTAYMLEKSYESLCRDYKYYPQDKTIVFIYENFDSLWNAKKSVKGESILGLYTMGAIHILSPNAYTMGDADRMSYFEKNGPILHEYAHKLIDDASGGNMELWLTEGLALYEEYEKNNTEWEPGFVYRRYFTAQELRNNFEKADVVQSYRQSFDTVKLLVDKYGRDKLLLLLQELKAGKSMDGAFSEVYGFSPDKLIDTAAGR